MSFAAAFAAAATSKSVTPLKAETVTTSYSFFAASATILSTRLIFWAFATEVPPNFNTFILVIIKVIR